jgi:ferrous iron transport protein B
VLDLPGAYSLNAASLDEAVTRDLMPRLLSRRSRAGPAGLRGRRHQPAPAPALRAGAARAGQADAGRAEHGRCGERRGIDIDVAALQRELGVPVVETVAVRRNGARALLEQLDAVGRAPHAARGCVAGARHRRARRNPRGCWRAVRMPQRTAKIDDALDRWLLHPVFGLLALAVVMFLIFQAVYRLGRRR